MCLAVPGKIVSVNETDPLFRLGVVDFGGVTREVNLACVPEAVPGDYVIVHVRSEEHTSELQSRE